MRIMRVLSSPCTVEAEMLCMIEKSIAYVRQSDEESSPAF